MRNPDLLPLGGGGGGVGGIFAVSDEWLRHPPDEGPWAHLAGGGRGTRKGGVSYKGAVTSPTATFTRRREPSVV